MIGNRNTQQLFLWTVTWAFITAERVDTITVTSDTATLFKLLTIKNGHGVKSEPPFVVKRNFKYLLQCYCISFSDALHPMTV